MTIYKHKHTSALHHNTSHQSRSHLGRGHAQLKHLVVHGLCCLNRAKRLLNIRVHGPDLEGAVHTCLHRDTPIGASLHMLLGWHRGCSLQHGTCPLELPGDETQTVRKWR